MKTKQIAVTYQYTDVWDKSLKQISETLKIISCLFHALDKYDHKQFAPLQMDGIPIIIRGAENEEDNLIAKGDVLSWVYKKAFEEYIVGLTESLIAAYRLFELAKLAKETLQNPMDPEVIQENLNKITARAGKLHFPALIEKVEKQIGTTLILKKEVLSINSIRNCLVHRNGFVSEKDFNKEESLTLFYHDLVAYVDTADGIRELNIEFKNSGIPVRGMAVQPTFKELSFGSGTKIQFDANIFNGLAYTCVQFIEDLYKYCPGNNTE